MSLHLLWVHVAGLLPRQLNWKVYITGGRIMTGKKKKNTINKMPTCEKYCTLLMFQWTQAKLSIILLNIDFTKIKGFIIIGTPCLVLYASTSGKDNRVESFPQGNRAWQGKGTHLMGFWTIPLCKSLKDPSSWVCAYQLPYSVQPTGF